MRKERETKKERDGKPLTGLTGLTPPPAAKAGVEGRQKNKVQWKITDIIDTTDCLPPSEPRPRGDRGRIDFAWHR